MIDFEKIVLETNNIIVVINHDLAIDYINPYGIDFFGYAQEEIVGKELLGTLILEKNSLGLDQSAEFKKIFDWGGSTFTIVTEFESRDGERYWLSWNNKKIFDSNNNFQELICVISDITPYMLTENALRESEELYRATFEVAPLGIAQLNLDGSYIRANQKFCDMLGYLEKELKNINFQKLTYPDDLPENQEYITMLLKGTISNFSMDKRYIHKKGRIVWVTITVSLVRDDDAQPFYFISIIRDISLQKQIEDELGKSQERFRILFNKSNDAIFVCRYSGKFFEMNDMACDKLKYTRDELLNLRLEDISNIQEVNQSINLYEKILTRQKAVFELDLFSKSGEIIPVESSLHSFLMDGHLTVLSVMRDIRERRKAALERELLIEELEKANKELKDLSQMKDDFLAIASHDLRSPFHAILGFSELLERSEEISEKNKKFVGLIKKNAEVQLDYIHDLLDIVRLESGKMEVQLIRLDFDDVIRDCIETLRILAVEKNITLQYEQNDNLPMVFIDHPKIVQVLNNLVANAIKFTHPSGNIHIRCFVNKNNEIETHIIDNGIGIQKSQIKHLFTRYKRIKNSGTSGEIGSGLGLVICKNLVELHGGKINVDTVENQGSDFYFTIPLSLQNSQ